MSKKKRPPMLYIHIHKGTDWYGRFSSGDAMTINWHVAELEREGLWRDIWDTFYCVDASGRFAAVKSYPLLEIERMNSGVLGTCSLAFNYSPRNLKLLCNLIGLWDCQWKVVEE